MGLASTLPCARKIRTAGTPIPPPPASLFQGYDSINGFGAATAIVGREITTAGTSQAHYAITADLMSLYQALDIKQSVAIGFGPRGSSGEKAEFVHRLHLTPHAVTLIVRASNVLATTAVSDFRLRSSIHLPLGNDALCNFVRYYGDAFVSSLTIGAEYYAAYTFYAQSAEQRAVVLAELNACGVSGSGEVTTDLQSKLDRICQTTRTRLAFAHNIAGIANPELPSPTTLVQYVLDFSTLSIESPTILGFSTTGYEQLRGFADFQTITRNRQHFIGDGIVAGLAQKLVLLQQLRNQLDWLDSIYRFYNHFSDPKITDALLATLTDIDVVDQQFEIYLDDPTANFASPTLPALQLGSPQLSYRITRSPAQGAADGTAFDDVEIGTYIERQTRISDIELRSGSRIEALIVTYTAKDAHQSRHHHGSGGGLCKSLTLQPGQFITQFSCRLSKTINALKLTLNNGHCIVAGSTDGDGYSWAVPHNSFVMGFCGRSGAQLNQIQVIYGTLLPAIWE